MDPTMEWETEAEIHLKLATSSNNQTSPSTESERLQLPEEVVTAPIFSLLAHTILNSQSPASGTDSQVYPQYGLLGYRVEDESLQPAQNDLLYANIAAPWSTFICGSQGSGKSHTLSCILENCLISESPAGKLTSPLAGLVLHYDKFTSFSSTQLCEAAYLCSSGIPVRVLVSPTNYLAMKNAYLNIPGLKGSSSLLSVEPMYLNQQDFNISMMKVLMGVQNKADQPLYMQTIMKILRDMAVANQGRETFDYDLFKSELENEAFMRGQQTPLKMRLDVLESFFKPASVQDGVQGGRPKRGQKRTNEASEIWKFPKGTLTIVDLSCPFVDSDDACALFNICISLFLKGRHEAGRVLAMDEAHKFLTSTSPEASELTETLLSIVRQQRHLGTRVVIATQEPTISPIFLDLCNVTIIHRFASPAWFKAVKAHIAGAKGDGDAAAEKKAETEIFRRIVSLGAGEALLFCPTVLLDVVSCEVNSVGEDGNEGDEKRSDSDSALLTMDSPVFVDGIHRVVQLGSGYARVRIRQRVTVDGGRSLIEK